MATSTDQTPRENEDDEGLDEARDVPKTGWRARVRSNPALRQPYRIGVFVLGLLFIALGVALAALPGPLTIPPVLLGLWIWSSEFRFAERLFDSFKEKAHEAWEQAKRRPVTSAIVTIGGLIAAGFAFWAVQHYELVDKAKTAIF